VRRVTERRRPRGAGILRLYPGSWRARYEDEMLAVLEQADPGRRARIDLARGAVDARLHADSRLPIVAALLTGGLWTVAGVIVVGQPAPPDWPGYLIEVLPLAIVAVLAGIVAIVGCWARQSDRVGRLGAVAVALAVAGDLAWAASLVAAAAQLGYGAVTMAAQAVALAGSLLVGIALTRTDDLPIGAAIALSSALMLLGWPMAWLAFGLAWTFVGVTLLARPGPTSARFA
jgi:hypothetical protein